MPLSAGGMPRRFAIVFPRNSNPVGICGSKLRRIAVISSFPMYWLITGIIRRSYSMMGYCASPPTTIICVLRMFSRLGMIIGGRRSGISTNLIGLSVCSSWIIFISRGRILHELETITWLSSVRSILFWSNICIWRSVRPTAWSAWGKRC